MARPSKDYDSRTKTARARLEPREKAYYRSIGPNRSLGYLRINDTTAGRWLSREWIGGKYRERVLGHADDLVRADGRDILTFDQAVQRASAPASSSPTSKLTVQQALDRYFDALAGRSKHAEHYKAVAAKHITPELGGLRVDRITKTQIEKWLAGMVAEENPEDADAQRRSRDTGNRVLTILKAALNTAFEDDANGIASDAAWRRVKPFHNVARAREEDLAPDEVRALIEKAKDIDLALATLIEAGYCTGARLGELVGTDVRDLSAGSRVLRVDGKTGPRIISLTTECAAFLTDVAGNRHRDEPLFIGKGGERWKRADLHRPLKRALAAAELSEECSFYTLRHAHISRALDAGMPPQLVAANCGTSLSMIERNYGKVLARTRADTIQRTSPQLPKAKK